MIYPISFLFIILSITLLILGIKKNTVYLLAINVVWWIFSIFSAYFVALAFQDRAYSEHWNALGFLFISLPIIIVTIAMLTVELIFLKKKKMLYPSALTAFSFSLYVFLIIQLVVGLISI